MKKLLLKVLLILAIGFSLSNQLIASPRIPIVQKYSTLQTVAASTTVGVGIIAAAACLWAMGRAIYLTKDVRDNPTKYLNTKVWECRCGFCGPVLTFKEFMFGIWK